MPSSRTLISSQTLGSSAASVTFNSIPATYTDLVVRASVKYSEDSEYNTLKITLNGSSSAVYSTIRLIGNGSAASSSQTSGATTGFAYNYMNGNASNMTNVYSSFELYLPNYLSSTIKPLSTVLAYEKNATGAFISANASLFNNTSAITSLTLTPGSPDFIATSSFYLYGIKNS